MQQREGRNDAQQPSRSLAARPVIAVIGIDEYAAWPRLDNAVSDATGVLAVFHKLGFCSTVPPLLNRAATGEAIRRLVTDHLSGLSTNDSLVVFFAGHGHTASFQIGDISGRTGYIVPADADAPDGSVATWIRLDGWLSDIARLPPRHILVIVDACKSGVALGSLIKWRDIVSADVDTDVLQTRRSRRIITSALDGQPAADGGPHPQHSLFTGCLIEGLSTGLGMRHKQSNTGSELALYVQRRVRSYPGSRQTPDFGALELDDRGEMLLPVLSSEHPDTDAEAVAPQAREASPVSATQMRTTPAARDRMATSSPAARVTVIAAVTALTTASLLAGPLLFGSEHGAAMVIIPDADAIALVAPHSSPFVVTVAGTRAELPATGLLLGTSDDLPAELRERYRKHVPEGEPATFHIQQPKNIPVTVDVSYDGKLCTSHTLRHSEVILWVFKFSECVP